jgi:ABC-type bacteriocin/lantibiotic exporter with double-glycine peptidase domain
MRAARIVQPLTLLIAAGRGATRFKEAAGRIDRLLAQPAERASTTVARARPGGMLKVDGVRFRYGPQAAPVLHDISFTLRPGGMHGIIGANGSGKTTLLKIMQGLYPPERGRVLIDGADLAQFGRSDLSRWLGYVPQDAFLFAGSVRDNIVGGRPGVDDAAIAAAARRANVDRFVVDLSEGYDTDVGEGGRRFSAGQRQRIALARALLCDPPILLLDEPNANLDGDAARQLLLQLGLLARTRNVVLVTHSPAFLAACHTVLVLVDGRIAAAGPGGEIVTRLFPGGRRPAQAAERAA